MTFDSNSLISSRLAHVAASFPGDQNAADWFQTMASALYTEIRKQAPIGRRVAGALFANAIEQIEANMQVVLAGIGAHDPDFKIVCREGCSYCCNAYVVIMPYEAVVIAERLGELEPAMQERVKAHCRDVAKATEGLGLRESLGKYFQPCPFLVDDRCSIYESRPIACRNWVSHDLGNCLAWYKAKNTVQVPQFAMIMHQKDVIYAAHAAYLAALGMDNRLCAMFAALNGLLCEPEKTLAAWLDGKPMPGAVG